MTYLEDVKAAIAVAKKASAGVKDPELREIARRAIYLHTFSHPRPKRRKKRVKR